MHGRVEKGENNGKMRILALPSARAPRSDRATGNGRMGGQEITPPHIKGVMQGHRTQATPASRFEYVPVFTCQVFPADIFSAELRAPF
jgi:hypothetical protein